MPGPQPPTSVSILSVTRTLTDAEIKTLPTSAVILVPPTEVLNYSGLPTRLPLPLAVSIVLDTSAGAYGNVDVGSRYVVSLGSDWSYSAMVVYQQNMPQLTQTQLQVGIANTYNSEVQINSQILPLRIASGALLDNALGIALDNGGDLTDGNPANSMKVTALYTIIDV